MKVTRRQLKSIIREFLDTSVRPTAQETSVYDQATNSERAAFISAMGIAEKASKKGKVDALQEGPVIPFRPRSSGPMLMDPASQSGEVVDFPVEDEDGDITPQDLDDYDLDEDPLEVFKQQVANAKASQTVVDPDGDLSPDEIDEYDLEDEVEDLLDAATGRAGENVAVLGYDEDEDEDEDDDIPPELRALMRPSQISPSATGRGRGHVVPFDKDRTILNK